MKKIVDGVLCDLTPEDEKRLQGLASESPGQSTPEERMAELEAKLKALEILAGQEV